MSNQSEIRIYLEKIGEQLTDMDRDTKNSILEEIEEHLNEKLEHIERKEDVSEISAEDMKIIIEDFGEPDEIASEYRRQLSGDEIRRKPGRSSRSKVVVTLLVLGVVVSLILAGFIYSVKDDEDKPNEVGLSGPWGQAVEWKPGGDHCLAVGEGIPIVKYDNLNVTIISTPVNKGLFDVAWHPDGDYAIICGSEGAMYRYDGETLTDLSFPMDDTIHAVKFTPDGDYAILVGRNGFIGYVDSVNWHYCYVPNSVVWDIDFYDLAWDKNGTTAIMVGNDPGNFMKGMIISFTPGKTDALNATYSVVSTPHELSTCFSATWVENWHKFMVTGNKGQVYLIDEDMNFTSIPNPFYESGPILHALWLPDEEKVLLVGGLAGWNSELLKYELEFSTRVVMTTDGNTLSLIHEGKGPHFLSAGWDPTSESAILIGSFGTAYRYQNGAIVEIVIDYDVIM